MQKGLRAIAASVITILAMSFAPPTGSAYASSSPIDSLTHPTTPYVGTYLPNNASDIPAFASATGTRPDMLLMFKTWEQSPTFDATSFDRAHAAGAIPILAWEPQDSALDVVQPKYSLANIAAGRFDFTLNSYAKGISALSYPVVIRFAHEMNGDWYPWGATVNGNSPSDYVAAWRHVHDVFAAQNVTNVAWMWSPNVNRWSQTPLVSLYPGDSYVDIVGMNGYASRATDDFNITFVGTIDELKTFTQKPIMVTETGVDANLPNKPELIRSWFAHLTERGDIVGVLWFNGIGTRDWRLTASVGDIDAYTSGLASYKQGWSPGNVAAPLTGPITPVVSGLSVNTAYRSSVSAALSAAGIGLDLSSGCLVDSATGACGKSVITDAGSWTVDAASLMITFTPAQFFHGSASSPAFRVQDQYGQIGTGTLHVNVAFPSGPSAAAPVVSVPFGNPAVIRPTIVGAGVNGLCLVDPATFLCLGAVDDKNGTWTLDSAQGLITFTPVFGFHGTATGPTLRFFDETNQSGFVVLRSVVSAPAPPTVTVPTTAVEYAGRVAIRPSVTSTDAPTACLSSAATKTCSGQVALSNGVWTLIPETFEVTYSAARKFRGIAYGPNLRIVDAAGQIGYAPLTVTVGAPNKPTIAYPATTTGYQTPVTISPYVSGIGPTVCLAMAGSKTCGLAVNDLTGSWSIDSTTQAVNYTPARTVRGTITGPNLRVTDEVGQIGFIVLKVTVLPAASPTVTIPAVTSAYGSPVTVPIMVTGSGTLTCLVSISPCNRTATDKNGTWTLNEAGTSATFSPVKGFYGLENGPAVKTLDEINQSAAANISVLIVAPPLAASLPTLAAVPYNTPTTITPSLIGTGLSSCLKTTPSSACLSGLTTASGVWRVTADNLSVVFSPAKGVSGKVVGPILRVGDETSRYRAVPLSVTVALPAKPTVTASPATATYDQAVTIEVTTTGAGVTKACLFVSVAKTCTSTVTTISGVWGFAASSFQVVFTPARGFRGVPAGPSLRVADEVGQTAYTNIPVTIAAPVAHKKEFSVVYVPALDANALQTLLDELAAIPSNAVGLKVFLTPYTTTNPEQALIDSGVAAAATTAAKIALVQPVAAFSISRPIRTNAVNLQGTIAIKMIWQY
jgi:hypothetical protein